MTIPGKTFLVGEYSVLAGGQGLLLSTGPGFVEKQTDQDVTYHPESAAGVLSAKYNIQNKFELHNNFGVGGFGQSTAEFISSWLAKFKKISRTNVKEVFEDYQRCYSHTEKLKKQKPSGADLLSLIFGQVTYVSKNIEEAKALTWPFNNVGFFILSTGNKTKTHDHLESLDRERLKDLVPVSNECIKNFLAKEESSFFLSLKKWSSILKEFGLQDSYVLEIKEKIEKSSEHILVVKPNGALGSDTVSVFYKIEYKDQVKASLEALTQVFSGLSIKADETMLLQGVLDHGMD